MRALTFVLATCVAAACSTSTTRRADDPTPNPAPVADTVNSRHAEVNLTGSWATGSAGEPVAQRIVLRPQCNSHPALWLLEQHGDTVRAWKIPESHDQGVATRQPISTTVPIEGRVSGVDLSMGASGARYVLHYDSTSGHLRGTLNGAPFWAVRLDVVRPEGCIPPP